MKISNNKFGNVVLYFIKESVYAIPTVSEDIGTSTGLSVSPIHYLKEGISPLSLGNLIIECLNNCRIGDFDFSESSFKDFLKLSKLKSQKRLNLESIRIQILFDKERIGLVRFFYDKHLRVLVSDEENKVFLSCGLSVVKLGSEVLDLIS